MRDRTCSPARQPRVSVNRALWGIQSRIREFTLARAWSRSYTKPQDDNLEFNDEEMQGRGEALWMEDDWRALQKAITITRVIPPDNPAITIWLISGRFHGAEWEWLSSLLPPVGVRICDPILVFNVL